jgi:hypothetical protein
MKGGNMKAYYAHPVILFGSKQQKMDIEVIEKAGFEVINPDDKEKQEGYKREGMGYFERLVKGADVVFYRPFFDGSIGAGIATEVRWAMADGKPIFEMPHRFNSRCLDVTETREILIESGRKE